MKTTTAKAHKPASAKAHKGKHKIAAIHIHPASNGFTVSHDLPRPDSTNQNPYPNSPETTPAVFDDQKKAHAHVGKLMGQMSGNPMAEDEPAAVEEKA